MRLLAFIFVAVQLRTTLAAGQSSDCASISQSDKEVILTANSWDPVYAIGATLADRYGINISVESPQWAFPGDTEDVAIADPQFSAQLLRWQKFPDFLKSSLALKSVLEMLLGEGVSPGDHEEDLS